MINQDDVDDSTEKWLDKIEERCYYKVWFCGYWQTYYNEALYIQGGITEEKRNKMRDRSNARKSSM